MPVRSGARKLSAKWAGPYQVVSQVGREAYRLMLPSTWRIHPVFHTSQLKVVTSHNPREAAVVLEDPDETQYEVERVMDSRIVRGTRQFLVKWKNYSEFESSWEPERNLSNAKRLVQKFLS